MTYSAPTPATAYAEAPPIARETIALLRLRRELGDERPAWYPPVGVHETREILLREAALLDRLALTDAEAGPDAFAAAEAIRDFDAARGLGPNGTSEGPVPPDAQQWQDDPRGYVRMEYEHWLTVPPWKPPVPAAQAGKDRA
ncbi:hypothetical protein AB0G79_33080 [Streptomyces sp. NPDC020807]|uniref:hypothetical protein n=1 Tax=Streptomyces sp. NPDC020807 TaxID=3155119 RepID=UPI0033C8DB1A